MKITIGLSYAPLSKPKYKYYDNAVRRAAEDMEYEIEVIDLDSEPQRVNEIDAIVFTGGGDIDPALYGKPGDPYCEPADAERDTREIALMKATSNMPVLGICRGAQLINVYYGGTLHTDLEQVGCHSHKKIEEDMDSRHYVKIVSTTTLRRIVGTIEGDVNSAHHQAIENLAPGFVVSARDIEDNTVEAFEYLDQKTNPYLMAVQWHPERMGFEEKFSGRLFNSFVWEAAAHKVLKQRISKPVTPEPERDTNAPS